MILSNRFRFCILGLTFLCLGSIYANQVIINFTFICMTGDVNDTITTENGTLRQRYDYDPKEKGAILMALPIGTIIGAVPMNVIYTKIGARIMFTSCGVLSILVTAATPWAAATSFYFLIVLRFLQGIAFSANYVTIGAIVVDWAPLMETATFAGFLTMYNFVAPGVTNPVSALLCQSPSMGWRWSFYLHAIGGAIFFTLWCALYSDEPRIHRLVSSHELRVIHKNKEKEQTEGNHETPFLRIARHPTVLVIWVVTCIDLMVSILLTTYSPIYFKKILGYTVKEIGTITSAISFLHIFTRVFFAVTSDRLRCVSERAKMLIYAGICFLLAGGCCLLISVSPWPFLTILFFAGVNFFVSANCGSVYKLASYAARQHAHFVISMMQFSKSIALFVGPAMVSALLHSDEDVPGWNKVFIINGCLLCLMFLPFWYVCSDAPAPFTKSLVTDTSTEAATSTDMKDVTLPKKLSQNGSE